MIPVRVDIAGKSESVEISDHTYEILLHGSLLRNRPIAWFLSLIVKEYGSLTEKNILKFLKERWVL